MRPKFFNQKRIGMKTVTLGVRFRLRTNRLRDEKAPLYLTITVNQKRCDIALKRDVKIADWHNIKGMAKPKTPELKELNSYLEQVRGKIVRHFQEMQLQDKLIMRKH